LLATTGANSSATTQREAAEQGQIVILAVPWSAVKSLLPQLGDLSGKIIVDITTADRQGSDGYPELAVETSSSELIQGWAPTARVVKTPFSGAATVRDPLRHGEPTVTYIAADDREAKEVVAELAIQLNFFPMDAGPLRMARTIDHLGLLYLTPMIQGRNHTWDMLPRIDMDLSCIPTEDWFEPIEDEDDLASFSNLEAADIQCPESDSSDSPPTSE
jgi:predicted dinucleotide-binding enzyme